MRRLITYTSLLLLLLPVGLFANGLTLSALTVNHPDSTVSFAVRWYNSWRITSTPSNYDAVWVFVKFRECGVPNTTPWTHGLVSTDTTQGAGMHSFGTRLEPVIVHTSQSGFPDSAGRGISPAPNNTGVMLRRTALNDVFPDPGADNIRLKIVNLPNDGKQYDVKVMGIEMVFIPAGNFTVGENSALNCYSDCQSQQNAFSGNQTINNNTSLVINFMNLINSHPANFTLTRDIATGRDYPRGTNAFHIMKYEITQGQYIEFLNTLPTVAQVNRFAGNVGTERYRITDGGTSPDIYISTVHNRAMNWLSWADVSAYLDWSALRPISELEYMKAARGTGPVVRDELAWGTVNWYPVTALSTTVPQEDGTEIALTPANANVRANGNALNDGVSQGGPVRVGLFALPTTTTREASGASFYGVMELSGNVWESVIPISVNTLNNIPTAGAGSFRAIWGDGNLDAANGNHDVVEWPAATYTNSNRTNAAGTGAGTLAGTCFVGLQGGSWSENNTWLRIEPRHHVANWSYTFGRGSTIGGRGAR